MIKPLKFGLGLGLGAIAGWMTAQQIWAWYQLSGKDVQQTIANHVNQAAKGLQFEETKEFEAYTLSHRIEDGIERISYIPKHRRYQTPIVFQHGMWHGAWCWDLWQGLLAEWGWESYAQSLPGHGNSDRQRNIPCCTLDYYLGFLKAEIDRFPEKPIVVGHSMGGALTQWYLKYVGDLAAAILVAPWPSHRVITPASMLRMGKLDLWGNLLPFWTWKAEFCRNPQSAANLLLSEGSAYTPEELYARLSDESIIVLFQHNPLWWQPADKVTTPMQWLAGELDAGFSIDEERQSAAHYDADFHVIEKAGHNVMMAHNYRETAQLIHNWLIEQGIE
jgi:pimeloyl-ACP methyl ester carboxylesterase